MARSDLEAATAAQAAPDAGATARAVRPDDASELLLWSLMDEFERLALERYAALSPGLATPAKRDFVARLAALDLDRAALAASDLAAPADALLVHARSTDEVSALVVQGLVLEHSPEGISVLPNKTPISDAIKAALKAMMADGTYLQILQKWGVESGKLSTPLQ
jgi:polar amino acid transport system substrate-binding protein